MALGDDAVDHGQAQAGALAESLGGEEGLEDVVHRLRVHAHAGVGDREHDVATGRDLRVGFAVLFVQFHVTGLQSQSTPGRHGIASIQGQVHEHLLELVPIDLGQVQLGMLKGDQVDVLTQSAA